MASDQAMQQFYERDRERDRLAAGIGLVEFERTIEIMLRTLPAAPALVADIGGGPGRYTDWLLDQGYTVAHRDLVPHHVDQVRARHGDSIDTAVVDACNLDLSDGSFDAVLLLGPLYHLPDLDQRGQAINEAARITAPGGVIYAASINRWSARILGMLRDRMYDEFPGVVDRIDDVDKTGVMEAVVEGGFTGYAHTPTEFRAEFNVDGLELHSLVAVEGVAAILSDDDIHNRLATETDRQVLFDTLRALEAVPDLMGASAHLLATVRRQ